MRMHQHSGNGIAERLLDAREQFLGYIRKRIGDPDLAEDILQDSLLRAIRAASDLRDEERVVPWFYRVLQNAIVDTYRHRGVERAHLVRGEVPEIAADPEDDAELCACFERLVPTLKPEYAELIRAVELRNEPPTAAASRLGITPNNLKVRRHRARQALRQKLEETCRTCADHGCLDCTCRAG